jgi:hypothetical protein
MSHHISTLHRNKRCLLAYQNHRTSKLRDLRFETSVIPPHLKKQLSKQEIEYFKEVRNKEGDGRGERRRRKNLEPYVHRGLHLSLAVWNKTSPLHSIISIDIP